MALLLEVMMLKVYLIQLERICSIKCKTLNTVHVIFSPAKTHHSDTLRDRGHNFILPQFDSNLLKNSFANRWAVFFVCLAYCFIPYCMPMRPTLLYTPWSKKQDTQLLSIGECGWLRACGKARGRHFEHLQLTGSVHSHPHSPGEDTCLWRTEKQGIF